MTKQSAVEFLTAQGHLSEVEDFEDGNAYVSFKYRGTPIVLHTYENDPTFLYMKCGYRLEPADRDELFVLRAIKKLEDNYQIAKIGYIADHLSIYATAEQFIPECPEFAEIFWRTAGLVSSAASEAWNEVNAIVIADKAAERFTEALEAELHGEPK